MAKGTGTLFLGYLLDVNKKVHDLSSDTLKLGFIDATTAPAVDDATPQWSDYSPNEVTTAGGYPAGGLTLTTVALAIDSGGTEIHLTAADLALAMNASGFTDARYGILYNSTATNDEAIGFFDFGADISEQLGPISVEFPDSVVLRFPPNVLAPAA